MGTLRDVPEQKSNLSRTISFHFSSSHVLTISPDSRPNFIKSLHVP
jgi:hypothetical protein